MREHVSQSKKATTTSFSIPSLKHRIPGFGLDSSQASPQAVPLVQPLHKPLTHDISRIPLRNPQAKLSISQPGDKYEQEADSVAQQVMQRIAQPVNRQSIQPQALPESEELQMKPMANSITPLQRQEMPEDEEELQMKSLDNSTLQRQEVSEEEEELQMKPMVQRRAEAGMAAAPDLEASINQARGGGQAMAENIRQPMEQAFGADFSGVKVHTDGQSDQLNRSIQAQAFTTGQDVFFRRGEYNPGSRGGQELLAHELTHVVQQNGGMVQRSPHEKTNAEASTQDGKKNSARGQEDAEREKAEARREEVNNAYELIKTGELWIEEHKLRVQEDYYPFEDVPSIEKLSDYNIKQLTKKIGKIEEDEKTFIERIKSLPFRIVHDTDHYEKIKESGRILSKVGVANLPYEEKKHNTPQLNEKHLANHDFVFFRFTPDIKPTDSRFGNTSMVFKPEEKSLYKEGWVSLHDMLSPIPEDENSRMRALKHDGKSFGVGEEYRTSMDADTETKESKEREDAAWDGGKVDMSKWRNQPELADKIKHEYKKIDQVQTEDVINEVFYAKDILDGVALSVLRECRRMGNQFRDMSMEKSAEKGFLEDLIAHLYRVEAKLPASVPYNGEEAEIIDKPKSETAGKNELDGNFSPQILSSDKESEGKEDPQNLGGKRKQWYLNSEENTDSEKNTESVKRIRVGNTSN
ncbi:eCIS core domain-containing protein [Nostoc sp.]|uniref:eCIS core domain-containing protein n=1 Tax=Nostoc sp. TaxID=1180 RepID=UPI002FF7EF1D